MKIADSNNEFRVQFARTLAHKRSPNEFHEIARERSFDIGG